MKYGISVLPLLLSVCMFVISTMGFFLTTGKRKHFTASVRLQARRQQSCRRRFCFEITSFGCINWPMVNIFRFDLVLYIYLRLGQFLP